MLSSFISQPFIYLVQYLIFSRWIPESASWELSQGQVTAATKRLFRIATINKKNLSFLEVSEMVSKSVTNAEESFFDDDTENILYEKGKKAEFVREDHNKGLEENKSALITSVMKYPMLRKQIATVMVIW